MGAPKTHQISKVFYWWPGLFDYVCALNADCLTCQNKKPQPKHRDEVLLEEWQNRTAPFRSIHIDLFTHQVTESFIVFWFLTHFLVYWCYALLQTLEFQLLILLLRNDYILSAFRSLLKTTEALPSSILTSSNGLKDCETPCDPKQHTRFGLMANAKPGINILAATGETSWTTLETTGLLLRRNSLLITIRVSITRLEKRPTR